MQPLTSTVAGRTADSTPTGFCAGPTDAVVREPDRPRRARPRGYTLPGELRPLIADAHTTRPARSLAAALADHLQIYLALATVALAARIGLAVGVLAAVLATAPIARSLRALECMVHEASHGNWWRQHRRVNDALAFVLAGIPTGAWIADYRSSHLLHHGRFGTTLDPDLRRYEELGVEDLDRSTRWRLSTGMLRLLPRYQLGWVRTVCQHPLSVVLAPVWCVLAVWLPIRLVAGRLAAYLAAGSWLLALLVTLTALRFLAEAGEHAYRGAPSVFDATLSNLGRLQRLALHPHNDGFHTVHHLWPGIPHHALPRVHRLLLVADPDGYADRLRYRRSTRDRPRTGVPAAVTRAERSGS